MKRGEPKAVWKLRRLEAIKEKAWQWLRKTDLRVETEALLWNSSETSAYKQLSLYYIDKTAGSALQNVWLGSESVSHIICDCKKLTRKKYKRWHDNFRRIVILEASLSLFTVIMIVIITWLLLAIYYYALHREKASPQSLHMRFLNIYKTNAG